MESQLQNEQHTREIGAWGVSHSVGAAQESLKWPPSLSLFFSLFKQRHVLCLSASITCLIQWWASKLFFYKKLKNKIDYFHHKSQDKFLILAFHACFAFDKSMGLCLWSVPSSDPGSVSSGLWDAGNWLNFLKLRFLSLAMIRTALQPCLTQNITRVLSRRHGSNSCLMMLFFPISRESLSSKKASPPCTSVGKWCEHSSHEGWPLLPAC